MYRPAVAMIGCSVTASSRAGVSGELGFDQPPDLLLAQAARAELLHHAGDERLRIAQRMDEPAGARALGDERAGAVAQLDHTFMLELAVGLGDRVHVDHELLRQRANSG